ncbi:unnamed protein product, partial [Rhizoctonia solani]
TTVTSGIDSSDSKLAVLLSPLACSVIDTLLCLLVDSPLALRVFEECNGLEVIVRTLKKVIGQSVRMKCLEFLYFYLQDEDVLAVTGGPAINLPAGLAKLGSSLAQPTPKPARTSKPSASKPQVSSPTSSHALQTPRRPKTKPAPTTETRPRRLPLERTASGDSTHSALSTRSDATDALEPSRINGRDSEMRSVSRSSTYSAASTASHMTDSSRTKSREPEREPKRLFPRLSVMPSLSYSSSTVSSTATNQTLDHHAHPSDKYLRIGSHTPCRTRSPTPNSPVQECFVPLPESPDKAGRQYMQETPKPRRRAREEETGVKVRVQETPRAKTRGDRVVGEDALLPNGRIFPVLGSNLDENPSNPFKNPTSRTKPTAPTLITLSLLKGEVDYEPESPKKHTPSRTVGEAAADGTLKVHPRTPIDARPTSNPFKAPTPKPSRDNMAAADSREPGLPEKSAKRRPRASEILPRPTPSRPVPRNVSTPTWSTPSTPGSGRPSRTATPVDGPESSPSTPIMDTPGASASTPARTKKVAVIPGGGRVPGRSEGGHELRKSMVTGAIELKKSQPSSEGLQRSQASSEGLGRSYLTTEGLRRNQPSSEALRKSPEISQKTQAGYFDNNPDAGSRLKKSVPSTPRNDGARRAARGGVSRVKRDGVESEGRSSGEMEYYPGSDGGKRSSMEDSPSRARGVPLDGKVIRTSAEKKELLGAWLGNVDALVEGVQRAGVWGLR